MLSIEKNQMMIEHFKNVVYVSNARIVIQMSDLQLCIQGCELHVAALGKDEILIEGTFKEMVFDHDKER